jgi:NADP-dependent 3-hydroxy acid dehydrogenase YdfG
MVLLITGATGGLGRGILKALGSLGVPKDSYAGSTSSLLRLPQDLKDSVLYVTILYTHTHTHF